jgi:hypothetical protein
MAADLFGPPKAVEERVRTFLMGVSTKEGDLAAFAPLALREDETKERLEWLMGEWTSATQFVLKECERLFKEDPALLVMAAAEVDFEASRKAKPKGFLSELLEDGRPATFKLGEGVERPILYYGKSGKDAVCAPEDVGDDVKRLRFCVEVADGRYVKLSKGTKSEAAKGKKGKHGRTPSDKEDEVDGGVMPDAWRIAKFKAQSLGGFLSTAFFASKTADKDRDWPPEVIKFTLGNQRRVRSAGFLAEMDSKPNEGMRQQCAQAVCSFLEKYLSVQPEVTALKRQHDGVIGQWRGLIREHEANLGESAVMRAGALEEAVARRPDCDPGNPDDVVAYRDWVHDFNRAAKELQDVLPETAREEMERKKIRLLKDVKGYPSFPDYKPDGRRDFTAAIAEVEALGDEGRKLDVKAIRTFVLNNWADTERHRLNFSRRPGTNPRKPLPVLRRTARDLFETTGGRISRDDRNGRWFIAWEPDDDELTAVFRKSVSALAERTGRIKAHLGAKRSEYLKATMGNQDGRMSEDRRGVDYAAARQLVDCAAAISRLSLLGLPEEDEAAKKINAIAGRAKGALLHLAEGEKREMQISGFSGKCKGKACSLAKGACLLVSGEHGKDRLALLVDYSKDGKNPVKVIVDDKADGLTAVVSTGGGKKMGAGKAKALVAGRPVGELGGQGIVLPLDFGTSQARRYLYPQAGARQSDGLVASMRAGGIDVKSARIVSETVNVGVRYQVALSVGVPGPRHDLAVKEPCGFVGVDRGENDLAVFARVDDAGRLVEEPESLGQDMVRDVRRGYRRVRRRQSQAKRLEGGRWFEGKIDNAVRVIAAKGIYAMLKNGAALALEDLSRGFGRAETASWEHQYTKVEDEIVDLLKFTGLIHGRPDAKLYHFTDRNDRGPSWFGKVGKAWTSQTCPSCGAVWGKIKEITREGDSIVLAWDETHRPLTGLDRLVLRASGGKWSAFWPGERAVPAALPDAVVKACRDFMAATNEKTRRGPKNIIFDWASHRSRGDFHRFRCRNCGVELDADKVGALNIARKALYQTNPDERRAADDGKQDWRAKWQSWYLRKMVVNSWWNAGVERMLK